METTSTAVTQHAAPPRGLDQTPSSRVFTGRYGRMFRTLPAYEVSDAALIALGQSMIQAIDAAGFDKAVGTADDDENIAVRNGELRLPAGYTYFGQFVDHDITFDPVSSLSRQDDPQALVDFRTPRFDLDSLYGRGPSDQPYLYEADGVHLTVGAAVSTNDQIAGPDLLRVASGRAVIGDPRNDENLIVSQLQSVMIRFHNAVVDRVGQDHPSWSPSDVFKLAQQQVRWHYQWVVVHDFLPRIVGDEVVDSILKPTAYPASTGEGELLRPDLKFFKWHDGPYMPLEFSVAAYRFGHSMVRPSYAINDVAVTDPPIAGVNRIAIFSPGRGPRQVLDGFRTLESDWGVQWKYFLPGVNGHDAPGTPVGLPQPSYKIDDELSHPLGTLPASTAQPEQVSPGADPAIAQSLAVRNLLRGKRLQLPAGQDVARAMGVEPLTEEQLFAGTTLEPAVLEELSGRQPLWRYCLREAKVLEDGAHLGPVGGRIVAEVLIGLLAGDPLSFLNVDPLWMPTLPGATRGRFTLADLINIAVPLPSSPQPPVYGQG